MSKKLPKPKCTPKQPSRLRHIKRGWNWLIWGGSAILFLFAGILAFWRTRPILGSKPGQAFSWSTGQVVGVACSGLPWWFWLGVAGIGLYLWWKHKWIMAVVLGLLVGLYLGGIL
jgi:hypothetical protein